MSESFLGVGWRFPVDVDAPRLDGSVPIALAEGEEVIRQSIWLILATARGERAMRPDFGCGIHDLVFETGSAATAGRAASEVREALLRWEPRIDLENVAVTNDPTEANRLLIEIEVRVRATNNRFNLVYPFYLEG